ITWRLVPAAVLVALAVVLLPTWAPARLAVTIVHELGLAGVGILVGRRLTVFVVSADMCGNAVLARPRPALGRAASTCAGLPPHALVGAVLVHIALHGWAPTALFVALVVLLISLVFTRSVHTLVAVLGTAAAVGALWWWGSEVLIAVLTLAGGVFLLLGALRHLAAGIRCAGRDDASAQLAALTP